MTIDDRLLAGDIEARQDALDIRRSFIVQAPAGSGKTELLIQRYLKLLGAVDEPEEIIAITFTRKAAAEMQYRVLAALQLAAGGQVPAAAHLRLTHALATSALARDRECGWQLLANPRRMRIQTLDALNGHIVRSLPISAPGGGPGGRLLVDADLKAQHRAAAYAVLDWLAEPGEIGEATRLVLTHLDNNTDQFTGQLSQMLSTRDQWLPFIGSGELDDEAAAALRAELESSLQQSITRHLGTLRDSVPADVIDELVPLLAYAGGTMVAAGRAESAICALAGITTLPGMALDDIGAWEGIAEALLTKEGAFRRTVTVGNGFPPKDGGEKAAMLAIIASLAGRADLAECLHQVRLLPPPRYSDAQWAVLRALFRLLPVAVSELVRLFARGGLSDHVEVAMTADRALGHADAPGDVALLLDYQVRHILVDEMQDTSSAQYRLIEKLTAGWQAGDGRTLYCVGDPMQSIYRFRNAEVGQFLLARQGGIGSIALESLVLRRNFRSGAGLVDWFNAVFPGILADRDDPADGAVSYSAAVAVPELTGDGRCFVHPLVGSDAQAEADLGMRIIRETLERHPGEEIAVLVRSRTHLPTLLAALRGAGIAYRAVEIDRLTDLPEVIEVLALTRAAVHLGDRIAWLALLRAPWIGLDWRDLHVLASHDHGVSIWALLGQEEILAALSPGGRAGVMRARDVLGELVSPRRSMPLRELVESCWIRLGGPAIAGNADAIENVYRYLDVLARLERHGALDDVAELEALLDDERASTTGKASVQVMTMHKAKGLEFDHVVLYGLGRRPRNDDPRVLSWVDTPDVHGDTHRILSPIGPRADIEGDPLHRFIYRAEQRKGRHEQARLLYVACTRARRALHLVGHAAVRRDGGIAPEGSSLLNLLWPAVAADYEQALALAPPEDGDEDPPTWAMPVLRRFDAPWQLPDPPPPPVVSATKAGDADDAIVDFYWVGNDARIAGTIVHRWLQKLVEGPLDTSAARDPARRHAITRRWLAGLGIAEAHSATIEARVDEALDRVFDDARGRWLLEAQGHAELPLTGVVDGEVVSVVLDRVLIEEDTHWIVDYKTSTHEGGDLEGFLRAECERYRPQLARYASLYAAWSGVKARCALYFPLLKAFVEIEP